MAISSNLFDGVDLSRLPPPTVVEQLDFASIRDAMLADIVAYMPEFNALTPADPAVKLVEYFAFRELLLRQTKNEAAKSVMLGFANGPDLDQLGALYNQERFVIVPADASQGIEEQQESDDDFRARIVRTPETWSVAGPVGAYVNLARNAHSHVRFASAISPSPGEVLVTIQSRKGDGISENGAASVDLISHVLAYLSDEDRRPLTDNLIVQSAAIKDFNVDAELRLFSGASAAVVMAAAQTKLENWLAENERLGRDVTEDAIHAQLRVEGVSRVTLNNWNDQICDQTEAAHCSNISLNFSGEGE